MLKDLETAIKDINNDKDKLLGLALAYEQIAVRQTDALNYCAKYNTGGWGSNVWHIILDDAIRMREELNKIKLDK